MRDQANRHEGHTRGLVKSLAKFTKRQGRHEAHRHVSHGKFSRFSSKKGQDGRRGERRERPLSRRTSECLIYACAYILSSKLVLARRGPEAELFRLFAGLFSRRTDRL